MTPENAQKLSEIQAAGQHARAIRAWSGRAGMRYEDGPYAGKVERRTMVPIQRRPAAGLIPVETWEDGRRVHFGNPITEVSGAAQESQPTPAAPRRQGAEEAASAAPPRSEEAPGRIAPAPKWFGSQEKAEAHVTRAGLAGSHEVRAVGRRFEVHPRQDAIGQAAAEAATSPANPLPEPSEAQKEAGNYRKGHVAIGGLDISIENPAGTRRRPEWPPLAHTYGYVRGSKGADGDHVDVFLGPNAEDTSNPVWIVDQTDGKGGLDEHKVMVGFPSAQAAREGYLANYTPGWDRLGGLRKMSFDDFKAWVLDPEQTARAASPAMRRKATATPSSQEAREPPRRPAAPAEKVSRPRAAAAVQENSAMERREGDASELASLSDIGRAPAPPRMPRHTGALGRLKALREQLRAGDISEVEFARRVSMVTDYLDGVRQDQADNDARRERARGPDWLRERLMRARRQGELDEAAAGFALWLLERNPHLAEDLGISIRDGAGRREAGTYNPAARIVNIFRNRANDGTIVHEILHHTERMMPPAVQKGIVRAWQAAWSRAYLDASPEVQLRLFDMRAVALGDRDAWPRVLDAFDRGVLNVRTHYALLNPSEFWAVHATDILGGRMEAGASWVQRARIWLRELIQKAMGLLGLPSAAPVLAGLRAVMRGEGERVSDRMLLERVAGRRMPVQSLAEQQEEVPEEPEFQYSRAVADAIRTVIAAARRQVGHAPEKAAIGPVAGWLARAAQRAGLDISDFIHVVDGSAVRHMINRHADEVMERSRGQIALTEADIEAIPIVIGSPDQVILGSKTRGRRDQIAYIKRMRDGSILYLEEVRTGRRELAAVTMRKYPAAKDFSALADTLPSNARSDGEDPRIVVTPTEQDKADARRSSVSGAARPEASRSTREALLAGPDGPMVSWLMHRGAIQLHAPGDVPRGAPRDVAGWADRDGNVHLLDNLSPSQARAFLLHETFHAGVKPLIGSRAWNDILSELGPLYTRAVNQLGTPLNRFWQEAAQQVVDAAEAGDPNLQLSQPFRLTAEEFGAYAVSQVDRAPRALRLWVEKAIGAIKAWALVRFGRQLGEVTPAQLHALARAALQAGAATQRAILANNLTDTTRYSTEERAAALADATATLANPPRATADFEGRVRRDMSLITRYLAHPRHIAALFRPFAPVYVAVMDRMGRRDRIISDLNEDYAAYAALSQESKASVNKVLELGRLLGKVFTGEELTGEGVRNPRTRVSVRYEEEGTPRRYHREINAALTKPGEVVKLTAAEADAYQALRKMFDRTLDMTRDRMLDEMGFSEVVGNPARLRELLAQARQDPAAGRKVLQVAKFVSDIEQSKRTGYVPFTRFGDYVVTVRRPRAIIQYGTDPRMPSRYLAFGVPGNDTMREFMDAIGARYDEAEQAWSVTSAQRQLLKEEMEETVYSEKIETGLRDLPREARAKWLEGKVSEIPAVRDAIARIRAEWAPEGSGNEVRAFQANAKRPEQRLAMSDIDALADLASIDNETWDVIRDKLSDAIQAMSFRKHFFSSDNVPGYSTDFERGITEYMAGMAGYLARREFQQRIDDALNGIEAKKLFEYATRYVTYTDGPQEEMALLRQLGFFTYIAGNISSGLVNLTQQAVMTFPVLSQFASPARVAAELARANVEAAAMMTASRDIGLNLFDPAKAPADVRDDLMDAWENGDFIPTATFEIMATANQRNVGVRPIRRRFERAVQAIGLTFSVPERINRLATYIAAHRLARDPRAQERVREVYRSNGLAREMIGGEKLTPAAFAEFMVDETQFRMGKANRPTIMRGLGAPALQFKGFMMQSLEAWLRMVASQGIAGRAAAATSIAVVLGLSGVWGFPGGDDLRRALERFLKWATDRDIDLRTALRRGVYEATGSQWIAAAADRGAPFASGLDLGRVGLGNVFPDDGSIGSLAGIPYDMFINRGGRMLTEWHNGYFWAGLSAIAPKFAGNAAEAWLMGRRGFADTRGRTVLSRDDITAWDQMQKAIGFTPTQVTNARDARYAISRMQASSDEARRQFVQRIGTTLAALQRATTEETRAGLGREYERIIREVARFNDRVPPENRVNLSDTTVRNAVRRQTEGLAAQYGRERRQARGAAEELRGLYGIAGVTSENETGTRRPLQR